MENEILSEQEFDQRLLAVYETCHSTADINTEISEEITKIMISHKEDMNSSAYLHMMYVNGLKYQSVDNKNAARFCAMRMRDIALVKQGKGKKPRYLFIDDVSLDKKEEAFIQEWTSFLDETYRFIKQRLILLAILASIILGALSIALGLPIGYAILEAIFFAVLIYVMFFKRLKVKFDRKQESALLDYIDDETKEFDRPYFYA